MRYLIILVNWNNRADTLECLQSIRKNGSKNLEILLIDNGSEDAGLVSNLDQQFDNLKIILNKTNLGFTAACNQGLEYMMNHDFDYAILLNNDTIIESDFFENLNNSLEANHQDIVSAKIMLYHNRHYLDNIGHRMLNTGEIIPIGFMEEASQYTQPSATFGSCGGATVFSRQLIEKIGVFDPYFHTGYEDAEFGARAFVSGFNPIYNPELKVYHKISQSVSKVDDIQYRIDQQKNIYYTYLKLMPAGVIIMNLPFIVIKYLLVMVVELILLKWTYLKIHLKTLSGLWKDRKIIFQARREFQEQNFNRSSLDILKKQEFFLFFDIKRLWKFTFGRDKNVFDKSIAN